MIVLHVSGSGGWGGNEQQLVDSVLELNKLGVRNIVLGLKNTVLQKECTQRNISFIEARGPKFNRMSNYLYLRKIVKQIKPDILHLHTSYSLTVFTITDLLFGLRTKTVFSKKGMGASSSFLSKYKYNYKGIDLIVCVSNYVRENFSSILSERTKKKLTVIHDSVSMGITEMKPSVNIRDKFSIKSNSFIIGNIANHTGAKDLSVFVQTADYLINTLGRKDVYFIQIGVFSGMTDDLNNLVKEKKLENNVFFTDRIANAFTLTPQFDIFLMTSQREGGPTSVLEAMLMGVPVVSTRVGVVPDVIENGVNGFISEVKDFEDLAKNIETLLNDNELRTRFSEKAKAKVKNEFDSTIIANQLLNEYTKLLK